MGKVTLWIDNVQIEAEEGQSVLNAALDAGIYIPHICSHPDLEPQGGCKLCVVEIDGAEPVTSCTTTVAEGMHVVTKTEQLDRLRGCEAHSTVILSQVDGDVLKRLGMNYTSDPVYQTNRLYHN